MQIKIVFWAESHDHRIFDAMQVFFEVDGVDLARAHTAELQQAVAAGDFEAVSDAMDSKKRLDEATEAAFEFARRATIMNIRKLLNGEATMPSEASA